MIRLDPHQLEAGFGRELGVEGDHLYRERDLVGDALAGRLGLGPKLQVARLVESAPTVSVVNRFRPEQRATEQIFHNVPVLKNRAPVNHNGFVTRPWGDVPVSGFASYRVWTPNLTSVADSLVVHSAKAITAWLSRASIHDAFMGRARNNVGRSGMSMYADARVVGGTEPFSFRRPFAPVNAARTLLTFINQFRAAGISMHLVPPEMHGAIAMRLHSVGTAIDHAAPATRVAKSLSECRWHKHAAAAPAGLLLSFSVKKTVHDDPDKTTGSLNRTFDRMATLITEGAI